MGRMLFLSAGCVLAIACGGASEEGAASEATEKKDDACFFAPGGTQGRRELRECSTDADCVILSIVTSCCGDRRDVGINAESKPAIEACTARKAAASSTVSCGCPPGSPVADDGSSPRATRTKLTVTCEAGLCTTRNAVDCSAVPECGPECPSFPMAGACTLQDALTWCRKQGTKTGEGCRCNGASWKCTETPEPLEDGCTAVCK